MSPLFIGIVILALILIFIWSSYNGLVTSRIQVKEGSSAIDVQLKRRTDLIPNLVETIKGYAKHEKEAFENVTKARSAMMGASNLEDKSNANNQLSGALKSLFAIAEAYPQLKANENFIHLQKELSDTEDKIAYARQFFNSAVRDYNTKLQVFPSNLIASHFGFKEEAFFETSVDERKKVEVKF